jgi:hypothetical protein
MAKETMATMNRLPDRLRDDMSVDSVAYSFAKQILGFYSSRVSIPSEGWRIAANGSTPRLSLSVKFTCKCPPPPPSDPSPGSPRSSEQQFLDYESYL